MNQSNTIKQGESMRQEMFKQFGVLLTLQLVIFAFLSLGIGELKQQQEILNELLEQDMIEYCVDINSMEEDNE